MIKPNVGENYHKRSELEVRVCNMPGSSAHRDFFFFEHVCAYQGNRGYPSSPVAGLLRARRWITQPAAVTSLPEWDLYREEREEHTQTQCFWKRGMERDTTGSLLSLKGKACRKWNSCTDSVTMDQYSLFWFLCENRMGRWTVYSCCADSLGVTETAGKGVEQQ